MLCVIKRRDCLSCRGIPARGGEWRQESRTARVLGVLGLVELEMVSICEQAQSSARSVHTEYLATSTPAG